MQNLTGKIALASMTIAGNTLMAYTVILVRNNMSKSLVKRIQLFLVQGVVGILPFSTINYNICFN